jgi:glycerophosphoryl diester phosphodiesterase
LYKEYLREVMDWVFYAESVMGVSPLIIGHRGAPGYRPEHTRSSYELACAMGADAVEPDVVVSSDGVLVVRHENDITGTTDVADRPEFSGRRTTKVIDGEKLDGWFTEDFTWAELATLRCRERIPNLRGASAGYDDQEPMLSLGELLDLITSLSSKHLREITVVLEIKHTAYFESLGFDVAKLVDEQLATSGWGNFAPLVIESFEPTVLEKLRRRGVTVPLVQLLEASGAPWDLIGEAGDAATTYRELLTSAGLDDLATKVQGISVDKQLLLEEGNTIVPDAHARGLKVYTWTCRPENHFVDPRYRSGDDPAAFGNYESEWAVIAATGLDGVFVDHADLGVGFFRR